MGSQSDGPSGTVGHRVGQQQNKQIETELEAKTREPLIVHGCEWRSMRIHFAGHALQGLLANPNNNDHSAVEQRAWALADRMLANE